MPRPDMVRNLEHYHNPQESDVWSEMMCVYHIVLGVTEFDVFTQIDCCTI